MELGGRTRVTGTIGVNGGDGTARLGAGADVAGTVVAESVALGRRAEADRLVCTLVSGGEGTCETLVLPLVPAASLPIVQVDPGPEDVVLPKRSRRAPLPAGRYGRLELGAKSTLSLSGGEYAFDEVRIGARSTVVCTAPCRIGIRGALQIAQGARLGPEALDRPADVIVSVQSAGAGAAVSGKSRVALAGLFYAPSGDVRVGQASRVEGSLVGRRVTIGSRTRVSAP